MIQGRKIFADKGKELKRRKDHSHALCFHPVQVFIAHFCSKLLLSIGSEGTYGDIPCS